MHEKRTDSVMITTTGETRFPIGSTLPLDYYIKVGFGVAVVCRDGEIVLDGEDDCLDKPLTVADAEAAASANPSGRWTIRIDAPLWNATWERREPERWICIQIGPGFA